MEQDKKAAVRRRKRSMRGHSLFRCFGGSADVSSSVPLEMRPVPLETARSCVSDDVGSLASTTTTADPSLSASSSVSSRVSASSEYCSGGGHRGEEPGRALSGDEAPSVKRRRQIAKKLLRKIARSAAFVKALQTKGNKTKTAADRSPSIPEATPYRTASAAATMGASDRCSSSQHSNSTTSSVQQPSSAAGSNRQPPSPPPQPPSSSSASTPARPRSMATSLGFLVLLTLAVMLFWGRACAILWTSTCLVLSPRRGAAGFPPDACSPAVHAAGALGHGNMLLPAPQVPPGAAG